MTAATLPVRWFADGAFAAAAAGDLPGGVRIVGVRGHAGRGAARLAIRAAVVADLRAWRGLAADLHIRVAGAPGEAPHVLLDGGTRVQRIWLAISHDGDVSVAAWRADGAVGIDVMAVTDVPDWQAVARDYLGPACADALAALPAASRPQAFARAWCAREARLKCLGRPLAEWGAAVDAQLAACPSWALDVPSGFVAALALLVPVS